MLTAPLPLYLDTSTTTFTGIVGALQSPNLNPFSHADLRQALELSLAYLPQLVARPGDPTVRSSLGVAALLANRASQSGYDIGGRGRSTGLSRQLRYRYDHIGQGASGAATIMMEMRLNREILAGEQARVAESMGVRREGMSEAEAAEAAIQAVGDFLQSVGMPTRLRDLQVPQADCQAIAEADAAEPAFGQDPGRVTDVKELVRILREAW